jgi:hypothetical protein
VLGVYTGTAVDGLTAVGTSDDNCNGALSTVTFGAVAGTTYHILVAGFDHAEGPFVLSWDQALPTSDLGIDKWADQDQVMV